MIVTREDVRVLFVPSPRGPQGSAEAFARLEAPLGSLRGRKFFATCRGEDYRACVALRDDDDPAALGLETGTIPGGDYVRRRPEGGFEAIAATFAAMAREHAEDRTRSCIEFYRRHDEVILFMPVRVG